MSASEDRLSEQCIRASWEIHRDEMRVWLLTEQKFNPKSVDRFIDNFVETMVFARIPSKTGAGIIAAWVQFQKEQVDR